MTNPATVHLSPEVHLAAFGDTQSVIRCPAIPPGIEENISSYYKLGLCRERVDYDECKMQREEVQHAIAHSIDLIGGGVPAEDTDIANETAHLFHLIGQEARARLDLEIARADMEAATAAEEKAHVVALGLEVGHLRKLKDQFRSYAKQEIDKSTSATARATALSSQVQTLTRDKEAALSDHAQELTRAEAQQDKADALRAQVHLLMGERDDAEAARERAESLPAHALVAALVLERDEARREIRVKDETLAMYTTHINLLVGRNTVAVDEEAKRKLVVPPDGKVSVRREVVPSWFSRWAKTVRKN